MAKNPPAPVEAFHQVMAPAQHLDGVSREELINLAVVDYEEEHARLLKGCNDEINHLGIQRARFRKAAAKAIRLAGDVALASLKAGADVLVESAKASGVEMTATVRGGVDMSVTFLAETFVPYQRSSGRTSGLELLQLAERHAVATASNPGPSVPDGFEVSIAIGTKAHGNGTWLDLPIWVPYTIEFSPEYRACLVAHGAAANRYTTLRASKMDSDTLRRQGLAQLTRAALHKTNVMSPVHIPVIVETPTLQIEAEEEEE